MYFFFFKQKTAYEMRISDGVQTCALPISARPLDPSRTVFPADLESVRHYAEEAISQSGSGRLAPFYDNVRRHFAWMDASGADVLKSAFDVLKDEGLLTYGTARDRLTVDWVEQQTQEAHLPPLEPAPELSDDDFRVLNALEDFEAARINFGVFEAWTSSAGLDRKSTRLNSSH